MEFGDCAKRGVCEDKKERGLSIPAFLGRLEQVLSFSDIPSLTG